MIDIFIFAALILVGFSIWPPLGWFWVAGACLAIALRSETGDA